MKKKLPFEKFKVAKLTGNMSSVRGGSETEQESTHPECPEVTTDDPDASSLDCLPEFPTVPKPIGRLTRRLG